MKRRKRNNRRVFLLLISLTFLSVLFATSSYAWFTANKTVTVSPITVNVETQGGIQISADAQVWRSSIGLTELANAATNYGTHTNQLPSTLEAVSSALAVDAGGKMEMFYGVVDTEGEHRLVATKETDTRGNDGKYVAFDVFLKADEDVDLYLTTNSNVVIPDGDTDDTGIKNATRVAFVNLGHSDNLGAPPATYQALNLGTSSQVYSWEPNYNTHTPQAIAHALSVYGLTIVNETGAPVPYDGVKTAITLGNGVQVGEANATVHADYFSNVNPTYKTKTSFSDDGVSQKVWSLTKGVTKMRWYMWVEGQDVDCENGASGGKAVFNVQLTTVAP